jgi:hypothetical protein
MLGGNPFDGFPPLAQWGLIAGSRLKPLKRLGRKGAVAVSPL